MKKNEFTALLAQRIQVLEVQERERIINFYEETIDDSMEDGLSEEEAVSKLGDINVIINDILAENHIVEQHTNKQNVVRMEKKWMYLILGVTSPLWITLGAAGLILWLCAYIIVGCCFLILALITIMPIVVVIAALIVLPFQIFHNIPYCMLVLGIALISSGLAITILSNIKTWWMWLVQKTVSYSVLCYQTLRERLVF